MPQPHCRIDHPERDVREDDDGRRSGKRRQIRLQPGQLFGAQFAHRVDLQRIVEPDEVHALVGKAVPAAAQRALAEALAIENAIVGGGVVLARHIEGLAGLDALDDLLRGVELRRLGRLGDIAGVQQQVRRGQAAR